MVQRRRRNYRNRVYSNLKLWLDNKLVERGWYDNVASGEVDWNGNNLSRLYPVQTDPHNPIDTGSSVQVWQGYRRNWVIESGMQPFTSGLTDPTIARSGLWSGTGHVSAAFDGTNGIAFDHKNGRMIIEAGLAVGTVVEVPHSYKEVWVDTIARDMITTQITTIDNTRRVAQSVVPSGQMGQTPMLLMEINQSPSPVGRQLGGGMILKMQVTCHIITSTRWDKDELIDFVLQRKDETVQMVDLDTVPAQYTYEGDFAVGWVTYTSLISNYKDKNLYITDVALVHSDDIAEDGYFTALLRMDVETWTNENF